MEGGAREEMRLIVLIGLGLSYISVTSIESNPWNQPADKTASRTQPRLGRGSKTGWTVQYCVDYG